MDTTLNLRIDFTRVMKDAVGAQGLSDADLKGLAARARKAHEWLVDWRASGDTFYELADHECFAEKIALRAHEWRARFDTCVVLGIGGSALGARCLHTALSHPFHNELPAKSRPGMRLYILDNVDADLLAGALEVLDAKKTLVNVITKSGSTAETMSQLSWSVEWLKRQVGTRWNEHLVATTDAVRGSLRDFADRENLESFVVPKGVGGRFSVLSPVGLVPAAACGIDVAALVRGARALRPACLRPAWEKNPAYLLGALHYLLERKKGKRISVMMPYSHRLRDFADWYRQLWAESLGKRLHRGSKREIFAGQTPVKALGVTDQHSQVQLYMEGPHDKVITFLEVDNAQGAQIIPTPAPGLESLAYLGGRDFHDLMNAEKRGTEFALTAASRPNLTVRVDAVTAPSLGALFFVYEVATAFAGALYEVDPFDQPGVELGKDMTYADLGKPGYEAQRRLLKAQKVGRKREWRLR